MADKAWNLVAENFRHRPYLLEDTGELYAAVRDLTLRAWEAREAGLARNGHVIVPAIITKLRLLRNASTGLQGGEDVYMMNANGGGIEPDPAFAEFTGWEEADWDFWNMLHDATIPQTNR